MTQALYALFEDAGRLLSGRVLSEAPSSSQIEIESGRRLKVKAANILLRSALELAPLLAAAQANVAEVSLPLLWECAPELEFDFASVSTDYFGDKASTLEQITMLLALLRAPHYFRRGAQKGHFKKADAVVVAQALATIEKRKQIEAQIEAWSDALVHQACPEPIAQDLFKILFKPDKNTHTYQAVALAAKTSGLAPLALLQAAKALGQGERGAYDFHWHRFLFQNAALSTHAASTATRAGLDDLKALPLTPVQAFSIDDAATTEIDDALSVEGLGTDEITLGIHIAAPALAIAPNDAVDRQARQRYSTVYIPGQKITMLPPSVVQPLSLTSGSGPRPVVSLYLRFDAQTLALKSHDSRIERIGIVANLRYDKIDHVVNAAWLEDSRIDCPEGLDQREALLALRPALAWLWRLAQALKAQREAVRGKPETFHRADFSFKLEKSEDDAAVTGEERVTITPRVRGAPLDLIVAECMIVANSTWGAWLASLGLPAIYRSQATLGSAGMPASKVRMGTKSLPHAGIGVQSYAWSTSPLRRYTDLVNQWQIVAAIQRGPTAPLVAPFKPKDAALFAIISGFEAAYKSYGDFQNQMERFWTLRYLAQENITELEARVLKNGYVRAMDLPLALPLPGAAHLPLHALVRIRLSDLDLMTLNVAATLVARLPEELASPNDTQEEEVEAPDDGPDDALNVLAPIGLTMDSLQDA